MAELAFRFYTCLILLREGTALIITGLKKDNIGSWLDTFHKNGIKCFITKKNRFRCVWTIYHTHAGTSSTVTDGLQKNTAPKIIIVVSIWAYAVSYCYCFFKRYRRADRHRY